MDKPALPAAAYFHGSPQPFPDDKKLDVTIYVPRTLTDSSDKDLAGAGISIEAGKVTSLSASFDTDPTSWDKHNVVTLCGAMQYFRGDGREESSICTAYSVAQIYQNGKRAGELFGPGGSTGFTVLPVASTDAACASFPP